MHVYSTAVKLIQCVDVADGCFTMLNW